MQLTVDCHQNEDNNKSQTIRIRSSAELGGQGQGQGWGPREKGLTVVINVAPQIFLEGLEASLTGISNLCSTWNSQDLFSKVVGMSRFC